MATAARSRCSGDQSVKSRPESVDRFLGRGHREVDEAAHAPRHLAVHGERRVEVLDLGGDAHVEAGRVEVRDRPGAADAGDEVAPERGVVVADRGDRAEAGDDGTARQVLFGQGLLGCVRIVSSGGLTAARHRVILNQTVDKPKQLMRSESHGRARASNLRPPLADPTRRADPGAARQTARRRSTSSPNRSRSASRPSRSTSRCSSGPG